jgi:hypothetical protein
VPPAVRALGKLAGKKRTATTTAAAATAPEQPSKAAAAKKRKASSTDAAPPSLKLPSSTSTSTSSEKEKGKKEDLKPPKRDSAGRLVFPDHPIFRPRFTPKEMIAAGVFGGCYFNPRGGKKGILGRFVDIDHREFPADWFEGVPERLYKSRRYYIPTNKYGVKAGQDQAFWEEKGWIDNRDPRGWFHWYCRFFCGRRIDDDERQISRWNGVAGVKGRWRRALANKCATGGVPAARSSEVSPVITQTLLHWADALTDRDVDEALRRMK